MVKTLVMKKVRKRVDLLAVTKVERKVVLKAN
jgi:hypothetical protein